MEADSQIGPLINDKALQKVEMLTDAALSGGAARVCGGGRHNAGAQFYTPTILTGVRPDMALAQQDLFGRSAERRGGNERVSTCRSRWSPYTEKTNNNRNT